jgi:hypothetical protein
MVMSVCLLDAVFSSSDVGMPRRTTFSTAQPARVNRLAAMDSSRPADLIRSRFVAASSAARTARTEPGKPKIEGAEVGSTTITSVTRPPGGGGSLLTKAAARLERTEPSSPIRKRLGGRAFPETKR